MSSDSNISRRRKVALSEGAADYTAKRDEIVRIAAHLFRKKGYGSTRLQDIAAEAGIDRASLYYYIGNKEELFQASIEGILGTNLATAERLAADQTLDVATRLRKIFETLMASYEKAFPQAYVYIQEQMHQVAREDPAWAKEIRRNTKKLENLVIDLIRTGIDSGEFRDDCPAKVTAYGLFGMYNWTHRWFTPGGPLEAIDVAQTFNAIFFDGLRRHG